MLRGVREKVIKTDATGVKTNRRHDVGPLSGAETRDGAEDACPVDEGTEPQHQPANYGAVAQGIARGHSPQQVKRLSDEESADHPERRLDHAAQASNAALADELIHRGNRASRAALDGKAHDASKNGGGKEGETRQNNLHGHGAIQKSEKISRSATWWRPASY